VSALESPAQVAPAQGIAHHEPAAGDRLREGHVLGEVRQLVVRGQMAAIPLQVGLERVRDQGEGQALMLLRQVDGAPISRA
jgi:hypothetical protein